MSLEPRGYSSVAWLGDDRIALAYLDPEVGIVVLDSGGHEVTDLSLPPRSECGFRFYTALARTASGRLGLADICDASGPRYGVSFEELDLDSGAARSLGAGTPLPFDASWTAEDTIVYSTGDTLCATLYRHDAIDQPVDLEVTIDGQRFRAGQDVTASPEACPTGGRAGFPSHSPDGRRLAFMASGNGDTRAGQGLVGTPWTIFIAGDEAPEPVLGGVFDPADLSWSEDGSRLLVAGKIEGRVGLWSVRPDGSVLTLISEIDAGDVAMSPSGDALVAIVSEPVAGEVAMGNGVYIVDLP